MIKLIIAFAALIVLTAGIFAFREATSPKASIGNYDFKLLIADSEEERQKGLSKRKKIDEDQGMLFLFEKPDFYKFWMKDMEFSVDIIFIKGDRISQIYTNAEVPSDSASLRLYPSSESVDKVLEIKGGLANKYNFKVGDKIEFKNLK